jgi:hypothetical protein
MIVSRSMAWAIALRTASSFVGGCERLKLMKTVSAVMTETMVSPASSGRATFCGSVTMTASAVPASISTSCTLGSGMILTSTPSSRGAPPQ